MRQDRAQPREAGERGVRRQNQDQHGGGLNREIDRPVAEHRVRDLGNHAFFFRRLNVERAGDHRDADEKRRQDRGEHDQREAGVARFGLPERGDAVAHGFDTRHRRATGRKRAQEKKDEGELCQVGRAGFGRRERMERDRAMTGLPQTGRDQREHDGDESIGGKGEHGGRFAHAAKIGPGHERDGEQAQHDRVGQKRGKRRSNRAHPGRDADRNRQHVIDQKRRRRDQPRPFAQILVGDEIRAAALRVGMDGLHVRCRDDGEQRGDDQRDRESEMQEGGSGDDEREEYFLGGVGDRGKGVGGE